MVVVDWEQVNLVLRACRHATGLLHACHTHGSSDSAAIDTHPIVVVNEKHKDSGIKEVTLAWLSLATPQSDRATIQAAVKYIKLFATRRAVEWPQYTGEGDSGGGGETVALVLSLYALVHFLWWRVARITRMFKNTETDSRSVGMEEQVTR